MPYVSQSTGTGSGTRAKSARAVESARYGVGLAIVGGVACVGTVALAACVSGALLALAVQRRPVLQRRGLDAGRLLGSEARQHQRRTGDAGDEDGDRSHVRLLCFLTERHALARG